MTIFRTAFLSTTAALFVASCSKDEDSSSGPSVPSPDFTLVASGFKNTASSVSQVSSKFRAAASDFSATSMSKVHRTKSIDSRPDVRMSNKVQGFLNGTKISIPQDRSSAPSLDLTNNSDCAAQLDSLNGVYEQVSKSLVSTSDAMQQFDGQLPDGVVKGGATEQFAVTYFIDLSKVEVEASETRSGGSKAIESYFSDIGLIGTSDSQSDMNISGVAQIGAGANDTGAIIGSGYTVNGSGEGASIGSQGSFAAGVEIPSKTLKFNASASLNANVQAENGQNAPINMKASSLLIVQAGANPAIEVSGSLDGNFEIDSDEQQSSVNLTDKTHSVSGSVKIEKISEKDIKVTMMGKVDGQERTEVANFTTDASGNCVIKNSAAK